MFNNQYDVVVLGGGTAGCYCAFLSDNKGLKTLLVEVNDKLGGQPLNLYAHKHIKDFPLFQSITANEFVQKLDEQLHTSKNIDIVYNVKINDFEIKDELIYLQINNHQVVTKNIVIAAGNGISKPNLLEIPGANIDKVKYIVEPFNTYNDKNVVILGGGDSAVDWANNIVKHSTAKITIIHRRDAFRASGENVNELMKNKNIKVLLNKQCLRIENNTLFIKDNVDGCEQSLNFDEIIVQYGQKMDMAPEKYIQKLNCVNGNKIIVDHNQKTNLDHVYAIGDVCYYSNRPHLIIAGMGEAAMAINDIVIKTRNY